MPARLKTFLQYVVIIGITGLLTWFSLCGLTPDRSENKFTFLLETWQHAEKGWLFLMAGVAMISHAIRAHRWRMLMTPTGYNTSLGNSFLSLMVGYLVNLVIPRGGEVSRCYNLYKLDRTPVEISFGTVVVERVVDVLCLVALVAMAFLVEADKLFAFVETLSIGTGASSGGVVIAIAAGGLAILILLAIWLVKRNEKAAAVVRKAWIGFKEGLLSVFRLRNKSLFIGLSIVIWLLYFLMSYLVILAFPETNHLGAKAVLSLFAIGSIAMAAPLPGGTGSYHVLVPQGLIFLYGVPPDDAIAFTFIFHAWQTFIMIVGGAVSLIVTSVLVKRQGREPAKSEPSGARAN